METVVYGEGTKRFFLQKPFSRIVCICALLLVLLFFFFFLLLLAKCFMEFEKFLAFCAGWAGVATGIEYVFLVKSFVSEWNNIQRNHKLEPHKRGDKPKNHQAQA